MNNSQVKKNEINPENMSKKKTTTEYCALMHIYQFATA